VLVRQLGAPPTGGTHRESNDPDLFELITAVLFSLPTGLAGDHSQRARPATSQGAKAECREEEEDEGGEAQGREGGEGEGRRASNRQSAMHSIRCCGVYEGIAGSFCPAKNLVLRSLAAALRARDLPRAAGDFHRAALPAFFFRAALWKS
jgi:hypothetical protein